jgi:hypothetical protein
MHILNLTPVSKVSIFVSEYNSKWISTPDFIGMFILSASLTHTLNIKKKYCFICIDLTKKNQPTFHLLHTMDHLNRRDVWESLNCIDESLDVLFDLKKGDS